MVMYIFTEDQLNNLVGLANEIGEMKELLYSKESDERYRGASVMLKSSLPRYNKLPEGIREFIKVDISKLEQKAVEILFNSKNREMVSDELLEKYGYIIKEKEQKA